MPIQGKSICDAILPPKPKQGDMPWEILKHSIKAVFTPTDEDALKAIACAAKYFGLVTEPSGAIIKNLEYFEGQTIVTTISGRNTNKACLQAALNYFDEV